MSPKELVEHGEEEDMWGGVFISTGLEKVIRMLVQTRANYPLAIQRSNWRNRGAHFSDLGIYMRCVSKDLQVVVSTLGDINFNCSLDYNLYH